MKMTLLKFGNPRVRLLTSKLSICFTILMMFVGIQNMYAATIVSIAKGGAWNNTGTWVGKVIPTATDSVVITAGGTVATGGNRTCAGIYIAGILSLNTNGTTLTVNGGFGGTGTLKGGNTNRLVTIMRDWTFTGVSSGALTINVAGTGNQLLTGVLSNANATLTINKPSGVFTINNAVTVGTFKMTAGIFDPLTYKLTAATRTFTGGTLRVGAATWAANYSGAITQPAVGIIEYNALGNQTINGVTYPGSLVLTGSGAKTFLAATTSITGNFTVSGTATAITVVNMTVGGNLIVGTGTTLTIGSSYTFGVSGTTTVSGTFILGGTGAKTFTGIVTVNAGGVWNETGIAAISFANGINNSGTFTASAGEHTFQTNAQALTGTFVIPNITVTGITLTNGTNLTVTTALIGTGTLLMGSNASMVLSGTSTITTLAANTNGSTVTYNGSSPQVIKSAAYQDLVLINGAGAILGGNVTVEGNLTLTAGKMDVSTYNLTVIGNILGANPTRYIKTSSTGRLLHSVTSSVVVFPVGNSTYDPVTIANTGTSDIYGVRVLDVITSPASVNSASLVQRYWNISEVEAGGSNLSIKVQWNGGETGGNYNGTNIKLGYHNGSMWTEVASTQIGSDPYTASGLYDISGTDITGGVTFAVGQGAGFLSGPTVAVSSLTAFVSQCINTVSAEKTYTVSGAMLTADIVITAPANYEISTTSGSGFTSSLTFKQNGGYVNATTIFVRFKPVVVTAYTGNITHTCQGSNAPNLALSGSGVNSAPTVVSPTSANVGSSVATLGGNLTAVGCAPVTEKGIYYSTTNGFVPRTGTKVLSTDTSAIGIFTANVTGLTSSTTYYYVAFATSAIDTTYSGQGTFTTSARAIYSIASGNLSTNTIWSLTPGGPSCACAPKNNDAVFIENGYTITIAGNTPTLTSLTIASGSTLTYSANALLDAKTLNINGVFIRNNGTGGNTPKVTTMNVNNGGKYVHALNNVVIPTANWSPTSTLEVTGVTTNAQTGLNQNFGNVIWNSTGQTLADIPFPDASPMTIAGNLTIVSTGTATAGLLFNQPSLSVVSFSQNGGVFNFGSTTRTLNISGDYSHTSGTIKFGGGGSTEAMFVFNGDSIQNVTSGGGTLSGKISYTVNDNAIVDFGNSTISGTTGTFTQLGTSTLKTKHAQGFSTTTGTGTIQCTGTIRYSSTGSFEYNGTSAQVTGNAIGSSGIASLTINNAAGVALSNAVKVNSGGAIYIGTVTPNSIFSDEGYVITATGTTLNMNSGTFRIGTSAKATTLPLFSAYNLLPGTTIEYASGLAQTIDVTPIYQNLRFSGVGIKTIDSTTTGIIDIAGDWSTTGGLANASLLAITVGGDIAGNGNITLTTGTINIQGDWSNTGTLSSGTSVITFDGAGSQTINSVNTTFYDLALVNSGNKTMGGGIVVNGSMNVGENDTFSSAGFPVVFYGDYINSGAMNGGSSAITITGTAPQIIDKLSTTGNVAVTKTSEEVTLVGDMQAGSLSLSGSGGVLSLGSTVVTLAGNLNIGSGATLNCNTGALYIAGVSNTNNGIFNPNTGLVSYNSNLGTQIIIPATYYNLTINNPSGVNMSSAIVVDGVCALTNGTLNIGANTLTLNGTVAGPGSFVGSNTSILAINGKGDLGTIRFTNNTNLQSLIINRTLSGTVTLGSDVAIVSGGSFALREGVLDLGTNSISVAVPITLINGMMNGTQGTLVMNSATAQTIPASLFTSNTLANLTVNNIGGVNLGGTLLLTGTLTPKAGTLAAGNNLTLVSDVNNTARIVDGGCSTCSYITGNIKVQQYVPAVARRWRFMGSPITNGTLADWKSETFITGVGGTQNGFDATLSNQASVYVYNESLITGDLNTGWEQATNITNPLVVGKGYRVFIRGDRSDPGRLTGTNSTQNAVTIDLVGPVNQGDITMPVSFTSSGVLANDGWCLLANPYPSAYDWNAHYDNGGFNTKLDPTIWVLNAHTGGYVSYNAVSNAGSLTNGIIPSGASFWVKANAVSPTLIFKEQFKVVTKPLQVFKTSEEESFSIKLEKDDITSDVLIVKYMDASTANYDALYDIRKMPGTVNINAYGSDNVQLSLTVRPTVLKADTIKLSVSGSTGAYRLIFANSQELALHDNALLIDTYLNTVTDLKVASEYPFSITSNAATQGLDRFYIVTGSNSALPVKLLMFGARKADKETVALNWSTAQEENNSHFEVQRSTDGNHFQTIGTVNGNGTTSRVISYNFMDGKPEHTNYYRLKQVDHNGAFMYSEIRLVQMNEVGSGIKLYPVPAHTELTFSYTEDVKMVRIYDIHGKLVLEQSANQQELTLHLGSMETGVYIIELTTVNGEVVKEKFVKD